MKVSNLLCFLVCCLIAALLVTPEALAQGERGSITGTITDQSGALIPEAEVTVTNLATDVKYTSASTSAGVYRVPALPPGLYKVSATKAGFKQALAENIRVAVAGTVTVDLKMEIGEVAETVNVVAESPLLQTSTTVGTDVNPQEFNTWPIFVDDNQRQPQSFIFNSLPGTTGSAFEGSINGGQFYSHEILVDGITLGRNDLSGGSTEFTPSTEQISEFQLQTNVGAEYGGAGSAVANFSIKTGGNGFHGTGYLFNTNGLYNSKGASDNFFNNEKAFANENSFGASLSGPIKKDRTFFFGNYEGDRRRQRGNGSRETVMSNPMRAGNFTEQLGAQVGTDALGRPVFRGQIFDPATTRTVNGRLVRDPFPGNIIPLDRFSTVSRNMLPQIPTPVLAGVNRNTFRQPRPFSNLDLFAIKVDHVLNRSHKISTYFNYNERPRTNNFHLAGPFTLAANPLQLQTVHGRMVRITEDWTISPTKVNSFRAGFNRLGNDNNSFYVNEGWPEKVGLKGVPGTHFPVLNFQSSYGVSYRGLGRGTCGFGANGSWVVKDDFTWLRGKHTLKMGAEFRRYYYNERNCGNESGVFNFQLRSTGQPGVANTGHSIASMLLGAVDTASRAVYAGQPSFLTNYPALYFQDEFKVAPRVTITAGIRWEIPRPRYEKHNFTSGFDPAAPNPGADGFPGALVFLEDQGRKSFQEGYYKELAPNFGIAWSVNDKTVLRAGYSLTYSPPIANEFGYSQEINGQTTDVRVTRTDAPNGFDPALYWDRGFPALSAKLPIKDPTLQNDGDVSYTLADSLKQPYYQHFNFSIQRELPGQNSLEVGYVATKGTRLPLGTLRNYSNMLPSRYLSLGDSLFDDINDHPEIPKPYPSFEGQVNQALRPFPQYQGVILTGFNQGNSIYHSLQVQARKRPAKGGLGYIVAYTFSKTLTDAFPNFGVYSGYNFQDFNNRKADRALASFSFPHDLKITTIWELPFGKGRRFLDRDGAVNRIVGGWTITAIQRYRSGDALQFVDGSFEAAGIAFTQAIRPDRVSGVDPYQKSSGYDLANGSTWINPKAFAQVPTSAGGVPLRFGNAPRYLDIYGPWQPSETVGILKAVPITETVDFEFRADATNVFNRTQRSNPDTDLSSDTFGNIVSVFGRRIWQLSGRIRF